MNIFVAKLSSDTTKEHLADLFGQYGDLFSAKVIMDRETNESRCFGFIEMNNDHEALMAIEQLDGFKLNGRQIVVKQAKPKEETQPQNNYKTYNNRERY